MFGFVGAWVRNFAADLYSLVSKRSNRWFLGVLAALIVIPIVTAGLNHSSVEVTNHLAATLFGFGQTPLIAVFFFTAMQRTMEFTSGETGLDLLASPVRFAGLLRRWIVWTGVVELTALASYLSAVALVQGAGGLGPLSEEATSFATEAAVKLAILLASVTAFSLGLAHVVKVPAAALMSSLALTLFVPGLLVLLFVATGNMPMLSQVSQLLPTQLWMASHSQSSEIAYDQFQHVLLSANDRLMLACAYGGTVLLAGGILFSRQRIR